MTLNVQGDQGRVRQRLLDVVDVAVDLVVQEHHVAAPHHLTQLLDLGLKSMVQYPTVARQVDGPSGSQVVQHLGALDTLAVTEDLPPSPDRSLDALHRPDAKLGHVDALGLEHLETLPDALDRFCGGGTRERNRDVAMGVEGAEPDPGLLALRRHVDDAGVRVLGSQPVEAPAATLHDDRHGWCPESTRRLYWRFGSVDPAGEHRDHRDVNEDELLERLRERARKGSSRTDLIETKAFAVVDAGAVADAESQLGFQLPPFFVRVLTEVGNGGFGPGYGILGLPPDGYVDSDLRNDLVGAYLEWRSYRDDPDWLWPSKLVALCNWGCATWSYLDCEKPQGRVLTGEANDSGMVFHETADSLQEWLARWVDGANLSDEMYEVVGARKGINPFTKEPIEIPIRRLKGQLVDLDHRK